MKKKKKTNQGMTVFRDKTQDLNGEEKDQLKKKVKIVIANVR